MELTSEDLGIQQQYKQGFLIRQGKKEVKIQPVKVKQEKAPVKDITGEQWFWDMAVMS